MLAKKSSKQGFKPLAFPIYLKKFDIFAALDEPTMIWYFWKSLKF